MLIYPERNWKIFTNKIMIDILRGLTPSFFMARMRDPLVHGFWCVGYVLNGKDKVATFFQMESAQEALVRMMKMGVDCKGMWEWKPENK